MVFQLPFESELLQQSTSVSMKEEGQLSRSILHSTTVTILQSQLFIKNKYYMKRERETGNKVEKR